MIILYMPVEQNINQSDYAKLLLKFGLSKYFGIKNNYSFSKYDGGKPFLNEYPDIDFNISHTKGMIVCGITDKGKIGVDIEHLRKVHKGVSAKVFHCDEIAYIDLSSDDSENRFFEIWTKKEAYTKYLGTGLRNNITDINTLSGEHLNKLHFKKIEDFFFSVYSDDIFTEPIKINYSEISNFL